VILFFRKIHETQLALLTSGGGTGCGVEVRKWLAKWGARY
jgi:hypothetical protein